MALDQGHRLRVGVALCTFNGERYLQKQLDSLLSQTVRIDEIIIGDDGSTDQTLVLLQTFAKRARREGIHVEILSRAQNLGYVANFSDLLSRLRSDLLFLCDQDDVWHQDRVERFVRRFDDAPELLLLHSDARLVDADGKPLGMNLLDALGVDPGEIALERSDMALDAILVRNFITGATCALRRSLVEEGLPVGAEWSHDEWLAVIASLKGGLDVIQVPTIDYRQHGGNQIGASRRSLLQHVQKLDLLNAGRRAQTRRRLHALLQLLISRDVTMAPAGVAGMAAIAWRMARTRRQLYRRQGKSWGWMVRDFPRLIARIANVCLAGAGWQGVSAACRGAFSEGSVDKPQ